MTPLSVILEQFNSLFGDYFTDPGQAGELIEKIPGRVSANDAYHNALENADPENAQVEHDKALEAVVLGMLQCSDELYKLFSENPTFRHWLRNMSFDETYKKAS